jgi:hypothetical protein
MTFTWKEQEGEAYVSLDDAPPMVEWTGNIFRVRLYPPLDDNPFYWFGEVGKDTDNCISFSASTKERCKRMVEKILTILILEPLEEEV